MELKALSHAQPQLINYIPALVKLAGAFQKIL